MQIEQQIWNRVTRQFAADCNVDKSSKKGRQVWIGRAPELEKGHLTDAAFGAAVREEMQRRSGAVPRIYEGTSPFFRAILTGQQAWMMADERILSWFEQEYGNGKKGLEWLGQFGELNRLNRQLGKYGHGILDCRICMMPGGYWRDGGEPGSDSRQSGSSQRQNAETVQKPEGVNCVGPALEIRVLNSSDILDIRDPYPFRHALCDSELMPCELAVAAVADGRIIGMAGATRDCPDMYQIGVDVLPDWSGRGIGSELVRLLAEKILSQGKIPFYSTAQTHIASLNTGLRAGFVPCWTEIFVK